MFEMSLDLNNTQENLEQLPRPKILRGKIRTETAGYSKKTLIRMELVK